MLRSLFSSSPSDDRSCSELFSEEHQLSSELMVRADGVCSSLRRFLLLVGSCEAVWIGRWLPFNKLLMVAPAVVVEVVIFDSSGCLPAFLLCEIELNGDVVKWLLFSPVLLLVIALCNGENGCNGSDRREPIVCNCDAILLVVDNGRGSSHAPEFNFGSSVKRRKKILKIEIIKTFHFSWWVFMEKLHKVSLQVKHTKNSM